MVSPSDLPMLAHESTNMCSTCKTCHVWCLMICQSSSAGCPDGFQRQKTYSGLIDWLKVVCHDSRPSADGHSEAAMVAIMTKLSTFPLPARLQVNSTFAYTGLYSCRVMASPPITSIAPLVMDVTTKLAFLVGLHGVSKDTQTRSAVISAFCPGHACHSMDKRLLQTCPCT